MLEPNLALELQAADGGRTRDLKLGKLALAAGRSQALPARVENLDRLAAVCQVVRARQQRASRRGRLTN